MALDVAALLRSLEIPSVSPVHVIGYSLGAAVALQLAVLDATTFKSEAAETTVEDSNEDGGEDGRTRGRGNAARRRVGEGKQREGHRGGWPSVPVRSPLVRSFVLFGFTSSFLAGKTPIERLSHDVLASEHFIRTLGVRAYGRLLAALMRFNWKAINENGGYPLVAPDDSTFSEGSGNRNRNQSRSLPVQRRRLDCGVLRRVQARNSLDGYIWQVACWRMFDVSAQLPAVTAPVLHIHTAGDARSGQTFEKKCDDVAALRQGHLALVPGPYSHGLPFEDTARFIDVAADFMDKVQAEEVA